MTSMCVVSSGLTVLEVEVQDEARICLRWESACSLVVQCFSGIREASGSVPKHHRNHVCWSWLVVKAKRTKIKPQTLAHKVNKGTRRMTQWAKHLPC